MYAVGDAPGTPQNVAHAKSQSREDSERTNPGPPPCRSPCPRKTPGLACVISRFRFVEHRPRQAQAPRQLSKGLPTTWLRPAPGKPRSRTGNDASAADSRCRSRSESIPPAYDDTDPFAGADPYAQEDIPMPTVAPEDDEYSMNDVSLGSPETMSLDDVKQFFEVVKPVEEYGPDDPKNPRNIQHVNKHDSE